MNKLLLILLLFCVSCNDSQNSLKLTKYPHIVIEKSHTTGRHGVDYYNIKVFDGHTVKWYSVDDVDYNNLKDKDTLKNFTIY